MTFRALAALPVLAALGAAPAAADTATALILDVQGATEPQVEAFEEIFPGATLKLAADATVEISHYPTCDEFKVEGGTISVFAESVQIKDGNVSVFSGEACPASVSLSAVDVANAGIILRSGRAHTVISTRPQLALVGLDLSAYERLTISNAAGLSVEIPVAGRKVAWPDEIEPLTSGDYMIVLSGEGAQTWAAQVTARFGGPRVTILRQ